MRLVLLGLLLACSTATNLKSAKRLRPEARITSSPTVEHMRACGATIDIYNGARRVSSGSAAIIRFRAGKTMLFLTAHHVVDTFDTIAVSYWEQGSKLVFGKVVASNRTLDLAVVESENKVDHDGAEAFVATDVVPVGEDVFLVSSYAGLDSSITKGSVSNTYTIDGFGYLRVDVSGYFGSSGGGIYNAQGELISLAQMLYIGNRGIIPGTLAGVDNAEIIDFLRLCGSRCGYDIEDDSVIVEPFRFPAN
jgi:S1-C subfamily serine protease